MTPTEWLGRKLRAWRPSPTDDCREGKRQPDREECARIGCDSVRLTELEPGADAVVTCLEDAAGPASRKLAAVGLLPGVPLTLVQRYPAYVLRLGYTELALDRDLASRVRVRPEA